jgi:transposase
MEKKKETVAFEIGAEPAKKKRGRPRKVETIVAPILIAEVKAIADKAMANIPNVETLKANLIAVIKTEYQGLLTFERSTANSRHKLAQWHTELADKYFGGVIKDAAKATGIAYGTVNSWIQEAKATAGVGKKPLTRKAARKLKTNKRKYVHKKVATKAPGALEEVAQIKDAAIDVSFKEINDSVQILKVVIRGPKANIDAFVAKLETMIEPSVNSIAVSGDLFSILV